MPRELQTWSLTCTAYVWCSKLSEPFDITGKDGNSDHGAEQRCVATDGSCDSNIRRSSNASSSRF